MELFTFPTGSSEAVSLGRRATESGDSTHTHTHSRMHLELQTKEDAALLKAKENKKTKTLQFPSE